MKLEKSAEVIVPRQTCEEKTDQDVDLNHREGKREGLNIEQLFRSILRRYVRSRRWILASAKFPNAHFKNGSKVNWRESIRPLITELLFEMYYGLEKDKRCRCSVNRRVREPYARWCERGAVSQFGSPFPTRLYAVFYSDFFISF
jgi:hypothetical protein